MFCNNCGIENVDGAGFCKECGAPIAAVSQAAQTQGQPNPAQPSYQQSASPNYGQAVSSAMPENPKYKKMGGWLLVNVICSFLAIVLGVDLFASSLYTLEALTSVGLGGYGVMCVVASLLTIAFNIVFVVMVFTRKPHFLLIYQIQVIVSIVIVVIETFMILGSPGAAYIEEVSTTVGSTVGAIAALIVWTLYFCRSVRVHTYMGGTEYIDKAIIKFRS